MIVQKDFTKKKTIRLYNVLKINNIDVLSYDYSLF